MDILKTIVGHHVLNLFTENVAFNIAEFLEESEEVKTAKTTRKLFYEALTHYEIKGKRPSFERYKKKQHMAPKVFIDTARR